MRTVILPVGLAKRKDLLFVATRAAFAAAILLCAVVPAHADQTCPALNHAQAEAALLQPGAPDNVQLAMEWRGGQDYTCTYSAGQNTLRITIAPYHARDGWPSYATRCFAPGGPLAGVGDEAVLCNTPDGAKPAQQEVLGHVRDTFFSVHMSWPTIAPPQGVLRHVAEQVASSLF